MNLMLWLMLAAAIGALACLWRFAFCGRRFLIEFAFAAVGALLGGLSVVSPPHWLSAEPDALGFTAAAIGAVVMFGISLLRSHRSAESNR